MRQHYYYGWVSHSVSGTGLESADENVRIGSAEIFNQGHSEDMDNKNDGGD